MVDDLIRRSDAIKAVENVSENYTKEGDREWHPHIDFITQALVQAPSADRPQGEWKHLKGDEWLCSECGYVIWTEGSWEHPLERGKDYCEHCGARMKGADDE